MQIITCEHSDIKLAVIGNSYITTGIMTEYMTGFAWPSNTKHSILSFVCLLI